jgi:hypothetical protein
MAIIEVEGLGKVEIEGEVPNAEETKSIQKALELNTADVEPGLETDTIIPELIDPNLTNLGKAEGLEKFGVDRPTLEAAGAIAGSVIGTAGANPATVVAGGTLGAMAGGQLHDLLQSFITGEPTNFGTQVEKTKKDLQRELLLQSFFTKIPGAFSYLKGKLFGKADKSLYESAKRMGFPLSLSDSGNMLARGYGSVIGVFPYVGTPLKVAAGKKANFLNNATNNYLNTYGPNVTLTKLGIDMTKASKQTYGDFKRVTGFLYKSFEDSAAKMGNVPIISTKNFKDSLLSFTKIVDNGAVTLKTGAKLKDPRKDTIYKYAKNSKNIPDYVTADQYKALIDSVKYYMKLSVKQPVDLKVLTGIKSALETDLRLLTKKSYRDNLLTNVYPLSKSKKNFVDPKLLEDIATKLKFADKVYANGLENSLITNVLESEATKQGIKLTAVPGKRAFETATAKEFKRTDKNIFGPGFEIPGSINVDQLGTILMAKGASPQLFKDLSTLVGPEQFKKFVRTRLQKGFDDSFVKAGKGDQGLIFDPYKFERNLGLTTETGRETIEAMLKSVKNVDSKGNTLPKLTIEQLDDFFAIAKNHAGLKIPNVSSFVARRATLGGTKSILGGSLFLAAGANPLTLSGASLIFLSRKTSRSLANPGALRDVMTALDITSPPGMRKMATLKLIDAMISDSQTKEEENNFKLMRETIELLPLEDIKKSVEDTINSGSQYLNMNKDNAEEPAPNNADDMSSIKDDTSQLQTPPLETVGVNPASFDKKLLEQGTVSETGLTQSEQAFLDDEEKAMTLRNRGMA